MSKIRLLAGLTIVSLLGISAVDNIQAKGSLVITQVNNQEHKIKYGNKEYVFFASKDVVNSRLAALKNNKNMLKKHFGGNKKDDDYIFLKDLFRKELVHEALIRTIIKNEEQIIKQLLSQGLNQRHRFYNDFLGKKINKKQLLEEVTKLETQERDKASSIAFRQESDNIKVSNLATEKNLIDRKKEVLFHEMKKQLEEHKARLRAIPNVSRSYIDEILRNSRADELLNQFGNSKIENDDQFERNKRILINSMNEIKSGEWRSVQDKKRQDVKQLIENNKK